MAATHLSTATRLMKEIDIAMLVTKTRDGAIAARPMSNNGDVDGSNGTSYHFTTDDGRIDDDLKHHQQCGATYAGKDAYVAVQARANLITDKARQKEHWVPDLEQWFADGLETEGLVLIELVPSRINYWQGRDEGEWVA